MPFSGGMFVNALLLPAMVVAIGFLLPFDVLSTERMQEFLAHPLMRLVMFGIASLTFFHGAHRLRFVLLEIGLKALKPALPFICYGGALLGTLAAAAVALGVGSGG
jgi:fumarate reductase subunit D